MRRDYFTVDIQASATDNDDPRIAIVYDGPTGALRERLNKVDGGTLDGEEIDVTFRRQPESDGVLSLTNRLTGEYVFEATAPTADIDALVSAADAQEDPQFTVRLTDGEDESRTYEMRTLLVYDPDGSLLRGQSLIPGGVEL
jgi:VCBS repeat-containing protein